MARKTNSIKSRVFKFHVLNIKIISDDEIDINDYKNLFVNSFKNKTIGHIRGERLGIIRQLFTKENDHYIYGAFCGFIKIKGQAFDIEAMDMVDFEIPKNIFPNAKESQFVFYPELHRVAIYSTGELGLNAIVSMLRNIFTITLGDKEKIDIIIEQSVDGFNKILDAQEIRNLHIEISPSNGDLNKDYI